MHMTFLIAKMKTLQGIILIWAIILNVKKSGKNTAPFTQCIIYVVHGHKL